MSADLASFRSHLSNSDFSKLSPEYTRLVVRGIPIEEIAFSKPLKLRLFEKAQSVSFYRCAFMTDIELESNELVQGIYFNECTFRGASKISINHSEVGHLEFGHCHFEVGIELEFGGENASKIEVIAFDQTRDTNSFKKMTLRNLSCKDIVQSGPVVKLGNFSAESCEFSFDFVPKMLVNFGVAQNFESKNCSIVIDPTLQEIGENTCQVKIENLTLKNKYHLDGRFSGGLKIRGINFSELDNSKFTIKGGAFKNSVLEDIKCHEFFMDDFIIGRNQIETFTVKSLDAKNVTLKPAGVGSLKILNSRMHFCTMPVQRDILSFNMSFEDSNISDLFSIKSVRFNSDIEFFRTVFGTLNGDSAVLEGHLKAVQCTFNQPPSFFNSTIKSLFIFENCQFTNTGPGTSHHYKKLKSISKECDDEYQERLFGSLELEAATLQKGWSLLYMIARTYSFINSFGRSLSRPLMLLVSIAAVVTLVLMLYGDLRFVPISDMPSDENFWFVKAEGWCNWQKSLYEATIHSFGPLGLFRSFNIFVPESLLIHILLSIQALVSSLLWFIFILGVRKRFKVE